MSVSSTFYGGFNKSKDVVTVENHECPRCRVMLVVR